MELVLPALRREYPNKIAHVLLGDGDVAPPRELTPVFFGCFDWHSAVHGHWTLVRLLRLYPAAPWASAVREVLNESLRADKVSAELAYAGRAERRGFEMPYGMSWLLRLASELRCLDDPGASGWSTALAPLESLAADRFAAWLERLHWPIRSGQHGQSAFAMGLVLDWARARPDPELAARVEARSVELYKADRDGPLAYEPSAYDFLSPCLGEADLMRRVLAPAEFSDWLDAFLPGLGRRESVPSLVPVVPVDRADGKLVHFDGLNLSRAWMLEGIAGGLPDGDTRVQALIALAQDHGRAGLDGLKTPHYAGAHWLGSFAVYWLTRKTS